MAKWDSDVQRWVLASEGGYVDHPKDPGGATNMGITRRTLAAWRRQPVSKQDVRDLREGEALSIYKAQYWDAVRGDDLPRAVPQRRRRVFVVGYLGDWRRAAAVLFDRQSLRGDPPPGRETGQGAAPTISARTRGGGGLGTDFEVDGGLIPDVCNALAARDHKLPRAEDNVGIIAVPGGFSTSGDGFWRDGLGPLRAREQDSHENLIAFSAKDHGADAMEGVSPTLRAGGHAGSHANAGVMPAIAFDAQAGGETGLALGDVAGALHGGGKHGGRSAVAFDTTQITSAENRSNPQPGGPCHPLSAAAHPPAVATPWAVRRLTVRECERLQGFPDDYTLVPYRGRPAADGPRYKALGNSMAVNAMQWIGERIAFVDEIAERETG